MYEEIIKIEFGTQKKSERRSRERERKKEIKERKLNCTRYKFLEKHIAQVVMTEHSGEMREKSNASSLCKLNEDSEMENEQQQ